MTRERIVLPGTPHHVVQRGSRRQTVFFLEEDRELYLELLERFALVHGAVLWTYCLMDNHVHHIVVPEHEHSLAGTFRQTHSEYSRRINKRNGWCGHLWQQRFRSFPMDVRHAHRASLYVLQNPVRAGLVAHPAEWPHSSARQHLRLEPKRAFLDDTILSRWVEDWDQTLSRELSDEQLEILRMKCKSGLPLVSDERLAALERRLERCLRERRRGRPAREPST